MRMPPYIRRLGGLALQLSVTALLALATALSVQAQHSRTSAAEPAGMVRIPGGYYRPFYITKGIDVVRIEPFFMDERAVTNKEFLRFVKANPQWRRSRIPASLAEHGYLRQWKGDLEIGNTALDNVPVVNVSWFAAHAYAAWVHKRLPTIAEWEYVAQAPLLSTMHRTNRSQAIPASAKRELILTWYAEPNRGLAQAGTVNENAYGVRDLFGQVWEWTEDFNSVIIPQDPRGEANPSTTCGAGAIGTIDPTDYATFMRFAMRNSLMAHYTVDNLGFRCVSQ